MNEAVIAPKKASQYGRSILQRWLQPMTEASNLFDIVAGMTLIMLVIITYGQWYMYIGVNVLCISAIVFRRLTRKSLLWFALTGVLAFSYSSTWYILDNHQYLIAYWCLAVACSLLTSNPIHTLALNARLLIGLTFFFATLWKSISLDYITSSFFHSFLLIDGRFFGLTEYIGGVDSEALEMNMRVMGEYILYGNPLEVLTLENGVGVSRLAIFMTWWTILIEGLIALCFLSPEHLVFSKWRDAVLLLFMLAIYPIAPVVGFGCVLASMGAVQSNQKLFRYWPVLYFAVFLIIVASTRFPFEKVITVLPFF